MVQGTVFFIELPYYDAIRSPVIDVMHNLFLGTAKNMMSIWKDLNLLTKSTFSILQQRIRDANVPVDIGRIPYKIESGMSGMTAGKILCTYFMTYFLTNI